MKPEETIEEAALRAIREELGSVLVLGCDGEDDVWFIHRLCIPVYAFSGSIYVEKYLSNTILGGREILNRKIVNMCGKLTKKFITYE